MFTHCCCCVDVLLVVDSVFATVDDWLHCSLCCSTFVVSVDTLHCLESWG